MQKNFDQSTESKIYTLWNTSGAFNPDSVKHRSASSFSIIMPPPNANDPLHIGHAMFIAIEDILVRYHRMKGDDTVWIPGTDHAGIETQFVFEKKLAKNGSSRFQFDRESLYSAIMEYVRANSDVAVSQMQRLGASADWSRFHFTLDPEVVRYVRSTFFKLYQDNLIYRDARLVNYCTKCGTSYSELEVNHEEKTSTLYYIRYRLATNPNEHVVVATTRPEPIFADTHLAVHPENPQTIHLIGQTVLNPLTDQPMSIIADKFVDPSFGTGIVKLTPAHDFSDFDVAKKHNLPIQPAIDTFGKITPLGGDYAGMKVDEARKQIVQDLQDKGLIEKIDNTYQNRVGCCYRCGRTIEPLPLPQFFLTVAPLAQKALTALDNKETLIYGAGREKILRHWLQHLRDWNISRQIVWGIRIPVFYPITANPMLHVTFLDTTSQRHSGTIEDLLKQFSLSEIATGLQKVVAPANATFIVTADGTPPTDNEDYLQETDTFDTWFSSGQWPVVTLQTSQQEDFARFYPTTVMETGYDILPFWVMRMMLLGIYLTGKSPFSHVYLHGLVRDEQGRKMSKSKGNVINPIDLVDKYGADALRMALVMSSTPGSDSAVGEQKVRGMRNFSNKIWNASRFVIFQLQDEGVQTSNNTATHRDAEYFSRLQLIGKEISQHIDSLRVGMASEAAYSHFWHWFCDEVIEDYKAGKLSLSALTRGLITFLKLLHPFTPYVTESVWQELLQTNHPLILKEIDSDLLIQSRWPSFE